MDSGPNTRFDAVRSVICRGQPAKAKAVGGMCLGAQAASCSSNYRFNIASRAYSYRSRQSMGESSDCRVLLKAAVVDGMCQARHTQGCLEVVECTTSKPSSSEVPFSPVGSYKMARSLMDRDFQCSEDQEAQSFEPKKTADRQCAELFDLYQEIHALCAHFNKVTEIKPKKVAFEYDALARMSQDELIDYCCREQDTSKQVQSFIELLEDSEAINKLRLTVERKFYDLIHHELGCYIPIALFKISEAFGAFGETYCIKNMTSLTKDKCAVKVMQALAEYSNTFSDRYADYFRKRFDKQIENQQSVLLLNKVITGVQKESSVVFLVEKLERDLLQTEIQHQNLLRVIPSLLIRLSSPLREKLACILRPHIEWLFDHKFGCFTIFGFLSLDCSLSISQAILGMIKADPVSMFTRRYRRFLLTKMVSLPGTAPLFKAVLTSICESSSTTIKKITNHESSAFLLLSVLAKTDDLRMMELCIARLTTLDSNNQRVIKGRQGKLLMGWINLLLDKKRLLPVHGSAHQ